jgi:hypothetical protein
MVSISHERSVESERRLRRVLRAATVDHLDGEWTYRRFDGATPRGALATISDSDGWCALVPASAKTSERYRITSFTFSAAIENSGFVGWVAMTIKRRLGSGVFVVCGDNPARGGVFDHLGYPVEIAEEVRALIDTMRRDEASDPFNLDLRLFAVADTSAASTISTGTHFEFRERHGVVEATYDGGRITIGFLTGHRSNDEVHGGYVQVLTDGQVHTGTTRLRVEQVDDQRLALIEDYRTATGHTGRNLLRSVEPSA